MQKVMVVRLKYREIRRGLIEKDAVLYSRASLLLDSSKSLRKASCSPGAK